VDPHKNTSMSSFFLSIKLVVFYGYLSRGKVNAKGYCSVIFTGENHGNFLRKKQYFSRNEYVWGEQFFSQNLGKIQICSQNYT